jgi:hypothetical protein
MRGFHRKGRRNLWTEKLKRDKERTFRKGEGVEKTTEKRDLEGVSEGESSGLRDRHHEHQFAKISQVDFPSDLSTLFECECHLASEDPSLEPPFQGK